MERDEDILKKAVGVRRALEVLKEEYGLKLSDVLEVFAGAPVIAAEAFASERTPLETITIFLRDERGKTPKEISKLLNRSTSIVNNALKNGTRKKPASITSNSSHPIPVTVLQESDYTPAEAIIVYLREHYSLPNAHVAKLLGRDARNCWRLYHAAQVKQSARSTNKDTNNTASKAGGRT